MLKKGLGAGIILLFTIALTACGGGNNATGGSTNGQPAATNTAAQTAAPPAAQPAETAQASSAPAAEASGETRTITYLGKEYDLPAKTERIVIAGAVEAMEDALVLDVQPVGAISFGGAFPPLFGPVTKNAVSIGEKTEPNFEVILSLKPDVILGSTKFPEEVAEKLNQIAPTILVSHISTNWEANLQLLGQISGKEAQAEEAITKYKADLEQAKAALGEKLKDKKAAVVRVRQGKMFVYPADVYFNPVIYAELGMAVPAEIAAAKAQEELSVEKFAEMNPDYLFIQFAENENPDSPKALEELQNNPVIKNSAAFKNGTAYINVVDPLAQGGTAFSKIEFLKAVVNELSK